jgi:NADP-dependent 3-hydroxy acid dehydrogenase YdfG
VLITGASSGFGGDAARLFASQGCKVILAARRVDRMDALVEKIQAAGGQAVSIPVDVTQRASIDAMVEKALGLHGHIDILFNNAGFGHLNWFQDLDPGRDIDLQVQVNLLGVMHVTHSVLPHMLARRSGHIINMSSVAGWIAAPSYTIYAATKFGVRAFTDALRREVAPFGIHVSGIYPGPAETEFGLHTGDHPMRGSRLRKYFRAMTSEYVAQHVIRLAKKPRRVVIIPWYYRIPIFGERHMPWLIDWIVVNWLSKPKHKLKA